MSKNQKRILVIGESCKDIFVYCDTSRLAPDIPVPVLEVVRQYASPGMAKNVERNIIALHKSCDIYTNKNWNKVTKTRYMHTTSNHAFIRVDADHEMDRIDVKKVPLAKYDIIAISDYNKGFLLHEDIAYFCKKHPCVFVDTKKPVGSWLTDAVYIKINNYEYERSMPIHKSVQKKIICTKGGDGAEFQGVLYPVEKVEVEDSSGAGDSFFAALIVRYAEINDIIESIRFANDRAAEVVQHRGVTVIRRPEPS